MPLVLHPDCACDAVSRIEAEASRSADGRLTLRFSLAGAAERLVLPAPGESARADGLWSHTCFEAFVRSGDAEAYVELNFAPSTQWAAYAFDGYRRGMRPAAVPGPRIEVRPDREGFELTATVDLSAAGLPPDAAWRVGLSAVIEERGGRISHWALAHPPGRADFHSRDCFALELPAPERP